MIMRYLEQKIIIISLLILFFLPVVIFGFTGQVVESYDTPGSFPTGLTFDGQHIWLADRKTKKIYCIDPNNGKVIRSIQAPAYWPLGLAWDGEYLWNADVKGGLGAGGIAPPFYGWAINKFLYSSAVVNPLFWLDKTP